MPAPLEEFAAEIKRRLTLPRHGKHPDTLLIGLRVGFAVEQVASIARPVRQEFVPVVFKQYFLPAGAARGFFVNVVNAVPIRSERDALAIRRPHREIAGGGPER